MLEIVLPVSEIALQRIRDCAAGGGRKSSNKYRNQLQRLEKYSNS